MWVLRACATPLRKALITQINPESSMITRRDLLRTTALASAAAMVPTSSFAGATPAPAQNSPIHLGLCSYTFRNFTRTQMIGFMKELHVFDLNPKDAKDHLPMDPAAEAQALADYTANGIHLHAAGAIYFQQSTDDDIRSKFEYVKRAGIKVIVAGDPSPETLPRLEKFVKEYDIRLAIHNHGPEDKLWPSPLDILKDIQRLDPRIGCCIDVGHTVRAGTDVVEAIHKVGPRLFDVHMKDLTDFQSKDSQVAVGDGKMPIHQIFEALIAIHYDGFVDLEYEVHADDPMPGVSKSFAYMRGVIAGMGYAPES
jgi:sugar phosphate isomerase/epimerase